MLPSSVRIWVCTEPQDFRRSFDGLALATREVIGEDPQSGALYAFVNKRANRLKILWWDCNGYCLLYKRLHRALVRMPNTEPGQVAVQIDSRGLASLLQGVVRERRGTRR